MSATRTWVVTGVIALLIGVVGCGEDEQLSVDTTRSGPTAPVTGDSVRSDERDDAAEEPSPEPSEEPEPSGPPELDPSTIPEAPAPGSLRDADLPADDDGIVALFVALPDELFGAAKELDTGRAGGIAADYSIAARTTPVGFQAYDVPASYYGDFLPEPTADHVVALFASGADWEVEAAGHDAGRYWVEWSTTAGGEGVEGEETIYSVVVGDAGSRWVFVVNAGDTAVRDELLEILVATANAVPQPPPPTPDEQAARAGLLDPSVLGPEWVSQIKLPPEAGLREVLAEVMSTEPACSMASGRLDADNAELSGLLHLLTADADAHVASPTLVARRDQSFEVEHTVAVFEDPAGARATFDALRDLGWIECISAIYGELMQGRLASVLPDARVTLDDAVRRELDVGDDAVAVRFDTTLELPDGTTVPAVHDVSIVVIGRAVSAVVQMSFGGDVDDVEVDEIIGLGARLVGEQFPGAG